MIRSCITLVLVVAASSLSVRGDEAHRQFQESRILSDRFAVKTGWFVADITTDAQVGVAGVVGTFLRLEQDLNFSDNEDVFRLDGFYRFNDRHAIDFSYLDIERDASIVLAEPIEIEDVLYTGALDSGFDSQLFKLLYKYTMSNNGKFEGGITAGLSTYVYDYRFFGEAEVDDGSGGITIEDVETEDDVLAPIPTVGMYLNFAITRKLIFGVAADFLDLEVGDYDGRLVDSRVTFDYFFHRNVGIGGGFSTTDVNFRTTADDPFFANYRYGGLQVYLSGVF